MKDYGPGLGDLSMGLGEEVGDVMTTDGQTWGWHHMMVIDKPDMTI